MKPQDSFKVLLATASYDNTIIYWDVVRSLPLRTIKHTFGQVNQMVFTNDKKYLAVATNPDIHFFEADISSERQLPLFTFSGHASNVTSIGFQKDDKWMFSSSEDKTLKIWDMASALSTGTGGSGCQRNYKLSSEINCSMLHPNQVELVCGCEDGFVYIINLETDKIEMKFSSLGASSDLPIRSLSINYSGTLVASVNESGQAQIWEFNDYHSGLDRLVCVKQFTAHEKITLKCIFSPNAKWLVTASADSTVKIWNTNDWSLENVYEGHKEWVWDCCFSEDSYFLITCASDKKVILWEMGVAMIVKRYEGHMNTVSAVTLIDYDADKFKEETSATQGQNIEIVNTVSKTGRVIKRANLVTNTATSTTEAK